MLITQTYKNAFTEVHTILDYIEEEDYNKIPQEVIDVIEENQNQDYEYEMNEDVDIFSQPMLPETKAILFNFFRDYWATPEQREKIKRMQREERQKIEEKKKLEFDNYDIFKTTSSDTKENYNNENATEATNSEKTSLIELKKESFFIKIINKIKAFFKL